MLPYSYELSNLMQIKGEPKKKDSQADNT